MPSMHARSICKVWALTMLRMPRYAFIEIRKFWSLTMPIVEFSNTIAYNAQSPLQTPLRQLPFENGSLKIKSTPLGGCIGLFLKNFLSNFRSHK